MGLIDDDEARRIATRMLELDENDWRALAVAANVCPRQLEAALSYGMLRSPEEQQQCRESLDSYRAEILGCAVAAVRRLRPDHVLFSEELQQQVVHALWDQPVMPVFTLPAAVEALVRDNSAEFLRLDTHIGGLRDDETRSLESN